MQGSVVHLDDGFVTPPQIANALEKGNFSACIILGWGSGDDIEIGLNFANSDAFQTNLVKWVAQGGRLMVQGERISHAAGDWPEWFGLNWKSSDCCRTTHLLNSNHWAAAGEWFHQEAPHAATGGADAPSTSSISSSMDVKACLVNGVAPHDNLFGTIDGAVTHSLGPGMGGKPVAAGQSAFTLAKYGEGTVSYFGDVNAEAVTIETVAIVAKGSSRAD